MYLTRVQKYSFRDSITNSKEKIVNLMNGNGSNKLISFGGKSDHFSENFFSKTQKKNNLRRNVYSACATGQTETSQKKKKVKSDY